MGARANTHENVREFSTRQHILTQSRTLLSRIQRWRTQREPLLQTILVHSRRGQATVSGPHQRPAYPGSSSPGARRLVPMGLNSGLFDSLSSLSIPPSDRRSCVETVLQNAAHLCVERVPQPRQHVLVVGLPDGRTTQALDRRNPLDVAVHLALGRIPRARLFEGPAELEQICACGTALGVTRRG